MWHAAVCARGLGQEGAQLLCSFLPHVVQPLVVDQCHHGLAHLRGVEVDLLCVYLCACVYICATDHALLHHKKGQMPSIYQAHIHILAHTQHTLTDTHMNTDRCTPGTASLATQGPCSLLGVRGPSAHSSGPSPQGIHLPGSCTCKNRNHQASSRTLWVCSQSNSCSLLALHLFRCWPQ